MFFPITRESKYGPERLPFSERTLVTHFDGETQSYIVWRDGSLRSCNDIARKEISALIADATAEVEA